MTSGTETIQPEMGQPETAQPETAPPETAPPETTKTDTAIQLPPPAGATVSARAQSGSGLAGLALILALAALAQPWALDSYAHRLSMRSSGAQAESTAGQEEAPNGERPGTAQSPENANPAPAGTQPAPAQAQAPEIDDARVNALQAKISSLEAALAAQETAISRLSADRQEVPDMARLRLFMAAQQLRTAAFSGEPFSKPLELARLLLPQTGASEEDQRVILGALATHAASGLPTFESLKIAYDDLVPDVIRAVRAGETDTPWMKFLTELENTVLIRRKNPLPPDGAQAGVEDKVARISLKLSERNLAAARDLEDGLPPAAQKILGDWRTSADALFDAEQALETLDALAIAGTDQTRP